ncbi:hypothetical protein SAMN04487990_10785 [Bizionia paragorgiae]|uniref:Lysylphosphatidylglycerol synthase TM region n=1 Tax=Bizionia paragorgiae TaxID=283786 RepID=A0A1H3YUX1_BIZPA|nr:hypothetical protein SAMN04487990_10785 [Bizionia paragorgiae]
MSKLSFQDLLGYFKTANYTYIVLGLFLGLLSHLSRAYRWLFMLEPMGYKVKLGNSIMAVFATYLVNYTIPRAGEVARASILTNYENVPFDKGFGSIVAERVADLIVLLLIITVTLFLQFDFIYAFFIEKFDSSKLIVGGVLLLLLMGVFLFFIRRSKAGIGLKIKQFVNGIIEGALSIFKMKKKGAFIFHTFFIWGMYLLMFYVTSLSVAGLNAVPVGAILVGFILATFSIAATNGGIGSYPEAIVIAFLLFGLSEDPSRAFGWIMWTSQTLMIIVLGGASLLYLPIYNRKK